MNFQCFPLYQKVNIPYLKKIPAHWNFKRLKFVFKILNGSTPLSSEPLFWDGDINWFTPDDLGSNSKKKIFESRRKITKEGFSNCGVKLAPLNSIAISTRAPIGHLAIIQKEGCVNQGCRLLIPLEINPDYYYYFLLSLKEYLQVLGQGSTFNELSRQKLGDVKLPSLSSSEQKTIADFLDYKTSQIDILTEKKEKLLKLLEEKRIALIINAVTKGLNPKVKMKPSGIDWLGKIPEHWKTKRLKFQSKIHFSGVDKKTKENEIDVYLCNYIDVYKKEFIDNTIEFMKATASEHEIEKFLIKEGDVLATKDSETPYEIAIPAYVKQDFDNVICGYHLAQIRADKRQIIGKYLFRMFQATNFNSQFVVQANGITRFGLGTDSFGSSIVSYPPTLEEQQKIVKYLDIELEKVDSLSQKIEENIGYLKEYRTSLITLAVTGKIDLRNWQPKPPLTFTRIGAGGEVKEDSLQTTAGELK